MYIWDICIYFSVCIYYIYSKICTKYIKYIYFSVYILVYIL